MTPNFWNGKRVFLTGHTGFKGTWLTLWLKELGAEVFGYSLDKPSEPSLFEVLDAKASCVDFLGDIRDLKFLSKCMNDTKPEIVLHLAAQPLVRDSYQFPVETYNTNVMGTIHVLEAIRTTPSVRSAVVVTTDKCYDNKEWVWGYRESDSLGGYDPYSSSKACTEIVVSSWRRSFFNDGQVGIATARAGNVIGGGDWAKDRIVPDLIRAFENGQVAKIRNPFAIRPWQHVLEPLCGYMTLCEAVWNRKPNSCEAWNFGPSDESIKTVEWIANTVSSLYPGASWEHEGHSKQPHEANLLALDCAKARYQLNWHPKWQIERTLEETVEWHKLYQNDPRSIFDFSLFQIRNYMNQEAL